MTILEAAHQDVKKWPELRLGQTVYNIAHHRHPEVVRILVGSDIDPFYHNDRIEAFLAHLKLEHGIE